MSQGIDKIQYAGTIRPDSGEGIGQKIDNITLSSDIHRVFRFVFLRTQGDDNNHPIPFFLPSRLSSTEWNLLHKRSIP
jgi:hypothetical protein